MRDLFKERDLGVHRGSFTSVVDNHGVIVLRVATTRHVAGCVSCACERLPGLHDMPPYIT